MGAVPRQKWLTLKIVVKVCSRMHHNVDLEKLRTLFVEIAVQPRTLPT